MCFHNEINIICYSEDYDCSFQCDVEVTDNGYPQPRTDSTRVLITVLHGTAPEFQPGSEYYATLDEDVPPGTSVHDVEATKDNPIVSTIITRSIGTPYILTILVLKFEIVYSTTS